MQETVRDLIYDCLKEIAEDFDLKDLESPSPDTRLFGAKSSLDSMALVALIANLEDRLQSEFGRDLILADERSMERRLTPFARVATLQSYILTLLEENEA